jgi:dolichol-phosphate mannosyltransferase
MADLRPHPLCVGATRRLPCGQRRHDIVLHPSSVRSAQRPDRWQVDVNRPVEHLRELKRRYEVKMGRLGRPLLFALVGCSGMVLDLVSLHFLLRVASLAVSRALAIWLAMTWNFWLNRRLTFSYARRGSPVRQYLLFALACSVGAVTNWTITLLLAAWSGFFAEHRLLAAAVGVVAGASLNYVLSSRAVFGQPVRR